MIELYKSSTKGSYGFDRHDEICRECAKKEVQKGYYVEYDTYLSRMSDCIDEYDQCEICGNSFFTDGRKFKEIECVIY